MILFPIGKKWLFACVYTQHREVQELAVESVKVRVCFQSTLVILGLFCSQLGLVFSFNWFWVQGLPLNWNLIPTEFYSKFFGFSETVVWFPVFSCTSKQCDRLGKIQGNEKNEGTQAPDYDFSGYQTGAHPPEDSSIIHNNDWFIWANEKTN